MYGTLEDHRKVSSAVGYTDDLVHVPLRESSQVLFASSRTLAPWPGAGWSESLLPSSSRRTHIYVLYFYIHRASIWCGAKRMHMHVSQQLLSSWVL